MGNSQDVPGKICLVGTGKLVESIANSLKNEQQPVLVLTPDADWPGSVTCQVAIVITDEHAGVKKEMIRRLEEHVGAHAVIAVNTESIPLTDLQEGSRYPNRIIGLNWAYPADLSFFLEIIVNSGTDPVHQTNISEWAKHKWNKDPYTVYTGISIRGRLFAAMAREAFYLVENDYATVESVDRSCRNDAGYYFSFAGNFRYMDLMGTGGYGVVMKTLNGELATQQTVGHTMQQLVGEEKTGMVAQRGFYQYDPGDAEQWDTLQRMFGEEVKRLMERYPVTFDYDSNP